MKVYYDLHIHTALSPCGDEDMTPNNIVNMAYLKGLGMIGITDHNSARNIRSVMQAAAGKIKVIPGIEVTTREEVHTLCYFKDVDAAEDMGALLKKYMQNIKNRPEIFGRQLVMDSEDNIIAEEEELLINAVDLDIYEVQKETKKRGGFFVPAHIDKQSYSVMSNLGFLPPDLEVDGLEVTGCGLVEYGAKYKEYEIITNSDAHYLENISECLNVFEPDSKITKKLLENLYKI